VNHNANIKVNLGFSLNHFPDDLSTKFVTYHVMLERGDVCKLQNA